MSAMIELPKYQSHKQVWALEISAVFENPRGFELHFKDKRYAPHQVSSEWYAKHAPQQGPGYFVVYKDGYQSYSPKAAFEEGHKPLTDTGKCHGIKCTVTGTGDSNQHSPECIIEHELVHGGFSKAALDVLAERRRQVEAEGYDPEHDDGYDMCQLSSAASCYAAFTAAYPEGDPPSHWPWPKEYWKPSDHRRNLVKAGALILAELERLDRAAGKVKDSELSE